MAEIPAATKEQMRRLYTEVSGKKIAPETDQSFLQALLALGDSGINEEVVHLYDEEFSPETLDALKQNPLLILDIFDNSWTDYSRTRIYGYIGAVLGWLEGVLAS